MVAATSRMIDLGMAAPDFELPDVAQSAPEGPVRRLADFADAPALLVAFICNHCPYVVHLKQALADLTRDLAARGLATVAINANDTTAYPADAPDKMAEDAAAFGYPFPYLFDETQDVAKAYGAICTPDFFLFDADRRLAYRGQFDGTRPGRGQATGDDLRAAVLDVLAGRVPAIQVPSMGCSIKWRAGNAPDWA